MRFAFWGFSKTCQMTTTELSIDSINGLKEIGSRMEGWKEEEEAEDKKKWNL